MISNDLFESAESDVVQDETAQALLNKLINYFYYNNNVANDFGMQYAEIALVNSTINVNGTYFMLDAKQCSIDIPGLGLFFGKRKSYHTSGMFATFSENIHIYDKAIFLWCTRSDDDATEVKKIVVNRTEAHNVLKHEFVHVIDGERRKKPLGYQPDPEIDPSGYYNSPGEFNAYFHNMTDRLIGMISGMRREPQSAQDYADLYDYSPDFMTMLKNTMTTGSFEGLRGFLKRLDKQNRRRAIKRIYALHRYAGDLLKKQPNSDQTA